MTRTRRSVLGMMGGAVLLAGCVGDDDDDSDTDDADTGQDTDDTTDDGMDADDTDEAETPAVQARDHETHGEILVGPDELTLYMFGSDDQDAGESTCHDDCVENWPPLTVDSEPTAGPGVDAELTTFEREDGATQVAADGWPLYYWAADEEPGEVDGQGVNDVWWVLDSSGTPIREDEEPTDDGDDEEPADDGNEEPANDGDDDGDDSSDGPGY